MQKGSREGRKWKIPRAHWPLAAFFVIDKIRFLQSTKNGGDGHSQAKHHRRDLSLNLWSLWFCEKKKITGPSWEKSATNMASVKTLPGLKWIAMETCNTGEDKKEEKTGEKYIFAAVRLYWSLTRAADNCTPFLSAYHPFPSFSIPSQPFPTYHRPHTGYFSILPAFDSIHMHLSFALLPVCFFSRSSCSLDLLGSFFICWSDFLFSSPLIHVFFSYAGMRYTRLYACVSSLIVILHFLIPGHLAYTSFYLFLFILTKLIRGRCILRKPL